MKTFKTFTNRKDPALTAFSADDNAALLNDACTNSATGYVRQIKEGGPVSVPTHTAEQVAKHLEKMGWTRA